MDQNDATNTPVKSKRKVFITGPVQPGFIAESIAKHSTKTSIGGHAIFLGQVRSDIKNGKAVKAIEYSAYEDMAEAKFYEIREAIFEKYTVTCLHIHHSLGVVKAGEICLFVFVSSPHRKDCFEACRDIVERIKEQVPVFGKETFTDDTYVWKENTCSK